jgi:hypothetical protein
MALFNRGLKIHRWQVFDAGARGDRENLLWIPKRGKMPPKLERMNELAARALAA